MVSIIRKITSKRKFDKPTAEQDWIKNGEIQVYFVTDLSTSLNKLSVYKVEDPGVEIPKVITAIAATREILSNLDYIVLDLKTLNDLKEILRLVIRLLLVILQVMK